MPGRAWLAALPAALDPQRRVLEHVLGFCERTEAVTSLSVGCSLGRGAGDELSDVDAAIGLAAPAGGAGGGRVLAVEDALLASLPGAGALVDVLRQRTGHVDGPVRRVFAQFADGVQLDVALMVEAQVRRGRAAPDFVALYRAASEPTGSTGRVFPAADQVSAEQVREWAFSGWCALADADKYLRRGSLWEAHHRLHQARGHIWALWAAARGAIYPWHGLSQVLDRDPDDLPPGIEETVAGLQAQQLLRAARASAEVLARVSALAAARCVTAGTAGEGVQLPVAMGEYVSARLASTTR
ncbi:hypothetical protein [Kineococcus sp. SYSU DK005]|uniref:hypothetical protein n=1 Tax=Kineococcus sp. SYSU DK005 TaxID=3383126 RepID=UPI003D7E06C2